MGDNLDSGIASAMADLGIDPNSLDASDDVVGEPESTEAESESDNGENEAEESDLDPAKDEDATSEGEEQTEELAAAEVVEEPKLTAKEFREIEAARVSLEAEKQAFTERMQAQEKEFHEQYHEKVKTHDEMDAFFAHLASKDPDLFDLLKGEFQDHAKKYNDPIHLENKQEIQALKKELSSFKAKASDEVVLTKLDSEMNKFNASIGKEAEAAGLKIDRKVIEDMWAKGLTVEEAFYAKYGAAFTKASASKAKVAAVEGKIGSRPVVKTAGTVQRTNAQTTKDFSKMSTDDVVNYFAKQVTGKA